VPRLPRPAVERIARYAVRPWQQAPPPVRREVLELLSRVDAVPDGVFVGRQARGGVSGELVAPADGARGPATVLYLHGGGYEAGSPVTHRSVVAALALAGGLAIFAADYRLSPEHPAPAALEDALAAYEAMLADADGPIALAGDSAGGGLALALTVAARERGLAAPSALALISPWLDLTLSGASLAENEALDVLLTRSHLQRAAAGYAAVLGAASPVCSPIRSDLADLPPMLVQAGGNELLLSDARDLAARAEAAGVEVELRVFEGLWHDFHVHAGMLAEADEALDELGSFLARAG
jgi:epsilon-lactone hydrolase